MIDIGTLTDRNLSANLMKNFNEALSFRDKYDLIETLNDCRVTLFFVKEFLNSKKSKEELLKLVDDTFEDLKKYKIKKLE